MANPEWGMKRVCQSCDIRFYDLLRDPIICPSCGTKFDPESVLRSRRNRAAASTSAAAAAPKKLEVEVGAETKTKTEAEDVSALEQGEDGDEAVDGTIIEDTSDLAEDDFKVPDGPKGGDEEDA